LWILGKILIKRFLRIFSQKRLVHQPYIKRLLFMHDEMVQELLKNQEEIGLKMLRHCKIVACTRYGWTLGQAMPRSKDPDTVVFDVIRKYVAKERTFVPDYPVLAQLKKGVESWLSAIYTCKESKAVSLDALDEADQNFLKSDEPSPRDLAANALDYKVLMKALYNDDEVKVNDELMLLVFAIEEGAADSDSQSEKTGIEKKRIYELRRKLGPIALRVIEECKKESVVVYEKI